MPYDKNLLKNSGVGADGRRAGGDRDNIHGFMLCILRSAPTQSGMPPADADKPRRELPRSAIKCSWHVVAFRVKKYLP